MIADAVALSSALRNTTEEEEEGGGSGSRRLCTVTPRDEDTRPCRHVRLHVQSQ